MPRVRTAGPFRDIEVLGRPAVGAPARRLRERETSGVADHPAAIFIPRERPPRSGEIGLRESTIGCEREHNREQHPSPNAFTITNREGTENMEHRVLGECRAKGQISTALSIDPPMRIAATQNAGQDGKELAMAWSVVASCLGGGSL